MKNLKPIFMTTLLSAICLTFSSAVAAPGGGTSNVLVLNSSQQPVPVSILDTPNVTVANFPATANVAVANPLASPIPVRDALAAVGTIVQQQAVSTVPAGVSGNETMIYSIPAGNRLIVDHLSAFCLPSVSGQDMTFQLGGTFGPGLHYFPAQQTTGAAGTVYLMSQELHIVYEGGQDLFVSSNRTVGGAAPLIIVTFELSGRLVPTQ